MLKGYMYVIWIWSLTLGKIRVADNLSYIFEIPEKDISLSDHKTQGSYRLKRKNNL